MEQQVLELNPAQQAMIKQLQDNIQLLQHQLNSAIAMALASANLTDINVQGIDNGKIMYTVGTGQQQLGQQVQVPLQ
jgi:hypothetical protein